MEPEYLIDSNVIIDYMSEKFPGHVLDSLDTIINTSFFLSIINKIELLGFKDLTPSEESKFDTLINASNIILLHDDIVDQTVILRKKYAIKLPDAIIAASALSIGATLITSDLTDFSKVTSLKILNPHNIK